MHPKRCALVDRQAMRRPFGLQNLPFSAASFFSLEGAIDQSASQSRGVRARRIFKGASRGGCRGALGLSGAKKSTSNAQGVGRQRAPRAAEFVSKKPNPPGGFVTY